MVEEGGGGRDGGGFGCVNLSKNPLVYRASPPLSAIDRFLMGQNDFSYQNQINPTILNKKDYYNSNYFCSSGGAIGGVFRPGFCTSSTSDRGVGFLDDFDDEEIQEWTMDFNSDVSAKDEKESTEENLGEREKKLVKGGNSIGLIKGQWTEEEDSKLVRLVRQFGIRKWAQIAEKMVGRAGKQCRERWHNHLRPDIKKDTWTEEEERMLVEAHQIVGNKWAEIAKRIPGRTENSIKNHWNATKRRQNARRKSGKRIRKNDKCSQSSFLQDYIKSQTNTNFNDTDINYYSAAATPATSAISDDPSVQLNQNFPDTSQALSDDSPTFMNQTRDHDDELNFMQNLFGNSTYHSDKNNSSSLSRDNNYSIGAGNNLPKLEEAQTNYFYSDLYISYLLDGSNNNNMGTSTPYSSNEFHFNGDMKMGFNQEGSSSERKEMDLIEMTSKFYFPYNN